MNNQRLKGIGGWLAFLIFSMMVLNPLFSLGTIVPFWAQEQSRPSLASVPEWRDIKVKTYIVVFVATLNIVFAGFRLWRERKPASVDYAIMALWMGGPIAVVALAVLVFSSDWESLVPTLFATTVSAIIWTSYLRRSVRVKNVYFPSDGATDQNAKDSSYQADQSVAVSVLSAIDTKQAIDTKEHIKEASSEVSNHQTQARVSEDTYREIARKEILLNRGNKELWAAALSISSGDKEKASEFYVTQRVIQLKGIHNEQNNVSK